MPDPAQINRSLSTIRTELEFLQASNVLSGPQFQSIMAQLPVRSFVYPRSALDYSPRMNYAAYRNKLIRCNHVGTKWNASTICRSKICDWSADVRPLHGCTTSSESQQCSASAASQGKLLGRLLLEVSHPRLLL
jgi:hypothetical protein